MRGDTVQTIAFSELGADIRASLQGHRWLIVKVAELPQSTAALAFSELEDVLVAVDHRGQEVSEGLWMRAVHLLLVSDVDEANRLQDSSGINKVLATDQPIEQLLW
jgi:hypothetical protein